MITATILAALLSTAAMPDVANNENEMKIWANEIVKAEITKTNKGIEHGARAELEKAIKKGVSYPVIETPATSMRLDSLAARD